MPGITFEDKDKLLLLFLLLNIAIIINEDRSRPNVVAVTTCSQPSP